MILELSNFHIQRTINKLALKSGTGYKASKDFVPGVRCCFVISHPMACLNKDISKSHELETVIPDNKIIIINYVWNYFKKATFYLQ